MLSGADPDRIRIQWVWSLDPDPGRQKWPTNAGCSLLRAKSFSCSLDVLYGDLGISKLPFLIEKI
jgi:hypothetical protein